MRLPFLAALVILAPAAAAGSEVAVEPTGDAEADLLAASGTGDADGGFLAVSALGSAHARCDQFGTWPCASISGGDGRICAPAGACAQARPQGNARGFVAVSGTGNSSGNVAGSGTGDAMGGIAVSALGHAEGGRLCPLYCHDTEVGGADLLAGREVNASAHDSATASYVALSGEGTPPAASSASAGRGARAERSSP